MSEVWFNSQSFTQFGPDMLMREAYETNVNGFNFCFLTPTAKAQVTPGLAYNQGV